MNFELTMEQQQLKDSVTNFARQHLGGKLGAYDFNKILKFQRSFSKVI